MAWTIPDTLIRFRTLMLEEPSGKSRRWRFRYWKVLRYNGRDDWGGLCDNQARIIDLCTTVNLRRSIENRIHEAVHASCPDLDEDAVLRVEGNIAAVLEASGVIPPRRKRKR